MRAVTVACLALLVVSIAKPQAQARPAGLGREASSLVEDLVEKAELRGKKVAVAAFADPENRLTALSGMLADEIELALVGRSKEGDFRLMDRRNLTELADEWKLGVNGLLDDESAAQAGRLLGADVLCVGKYSIVGKKAVVRASLIGAERGEILGAASVEFKLDDDLREYAAKPVAGSKAAGPSEPAASTGPLQVELWSEKEEYRFGEKFTLNAKVNQDCYLTLIEVGPEGKATVIFPNHYSQGNAVKAGVVYKVPDPSAGFEFEVAPPAGLQLVRAIASKEPSVDLKDVMGRTSEEVPFSEVKQEVAILTRDIRVKAKTAKPGQWSESVLRIAVRER